MEAQRGHAEWCAAIGNVRQSSEATMRATMLRFEEARQK